MKFVVHHAMDGSVCEDGVKLTLTYKLAQTFQSGLKQAKLVQWTGSAIKSDSLVFYFLVKDAEQAGYLIVNCFDEDEHQSEFKSVKISRI